MIRTTSSYEFVSRKICMPTKMTLTPSLRLPIDILYIGNAMTNIFWQQVFQQNQ